MHFSHMHPDGGSKAGKFALVAGLHALIAVGVVNMMNNKTFPLTTIIDSIPIAPPEVQKPVEPPPEPPKPRTEVAPPELFVPKVEIDVTPPLVEPTVIATTKVEPVQPPVAPVRSDPPAQVDTPAAKPGAIRSAVLADANSCIKPSYPIQAARNGDTGTVYLALLVGTDGRVTSSRVQKTSGHRELDRAAMNALSLCQFKPAMNNGVPEAGWAQIAYDWKLDE
ncbi:energy transducer TonB [Massilia sp. Dwa41.01b]|uniref:energy transducer TonB n=1 Tax=unclassified Massilia TaxID=2609279 RepID=UPI0016027194|nr:MULTISPECIES: energy transducer TonB [unclassified Massilia]QNA90705.1 energy transducer TonB [Massilia sp. Dwa41.01b]QNA97937.1 energy transducer TonB [Massilia sp. Se16.2.3]